MDVDLRRGIELYQKKRYKQALSEFSALEGQTADQPRLAYYLGLTYTQLEKYEEAIIYFEIVANSHKNILHVYQSRMILAYIYTITNRFKLATFEIDRLIEEGYESVQAYAASGYIAYIQYDFDKSIALLEKAVVLDPENANSLNSLGFVMAEDNRDLNNALAYCRKALDMEPENYLYLDSVGWVYYKLNKYDEALVYLRKALAFSHGDKTVASHLKKVMDETKKNTN